MIGCVSNFDSITNPSYGCIQPNNPITAQLTGYKCGIWNEERQQCKWRPDRLHPIAEFATRTASSANGGLTCVQNLE